MPRRSSQFHNCTAIWGGRGARVVRAGRVPDKLSRGDGLSGGWGARACLPFAIVRRRRVMFCKTPGVGRACRAILDSDVEDLPESSQVSEARPGAPGTSGDPNGGQIPYIPYNPNAIPIPGGLGTAPNKPTPTPQQKEQQLKDELGHGCTVVSGLLVLGDAAIVFSGQGYLAPASLSLSFHAWAACGLATW
jgi:hypothetical protein